MNTKYLPHFWARNIALTLALMLTLLNTATVQATGETLDPTFGTNGIVTTDYGSNNDTGNKILLQSDGKIVTLGFSQLDGSNTRIPVITRYNTNGVIDNTFGANGKLVVEIEGFSGCDIEFQPNGKLIVAGTYAGNLAAARYTSNGSGLDNTFGTNGITTTEIISEDSKWYCRDLVIGSNGKIVIVGTQSSQSVHTNIVIGSFNEDGTLNFRKLLDKTDFFEPSIFNNGSAVAIQTDGKIILSGYMQNSENIGHISLARINDDGSADTTFGNNAKGTVKIVLPNFYHADGAILLDSNGKITVAGVVFTDNNHTSNDLAIARINSNGTLDTSFNGSGIAITDFGSKEIGNDIILQPDGKIIMVGSILNAGATDTLLLRYNSDGTLDTSFGTNGKIVTNINGASNSGNAIVSQTDGKIIVAGTSNTDAFIARYNLTNNTPPTTTTVTFNSKGPQDGLILESGENTNKGGTVDKVSTTISVGDNQKDWQYRGFLSFNTSTLPDNAIITSVQLSIKRQGLIGSDPFNTHGDLLVDISNIAFGNNTDLIATDFNAAAAIGSSSEKLPASVSPWYFVNLSSANLAFINKYGLTQFRLRFTKDDNDNLKADYIKFFSGESPAASQPQLIITYSLP